MSFSQLLNIIWARKWAFLAISGALMALVATASLLLPKSYLAEAAVVIDADGNTPLTGGDNRTSTQLQSTILATQMDVLASRNVARKVIAEQRLDQQPQWREQFAQTGLDARFMQDWLIDALLSSLNVRSSHNGNVVFLQVAHADPQVAADLANGFADAYIKTTLELRVAPARQQSQWFATQVKELRTAYEQAQQKVSEYQVKHGVIGTDDARLDAENNRLEELTNQLVAAQSSLYASGARAQQMQEAQALNRPDELSDLMKSPLLQNLKTELARAEAKFADVAQRFDRNHPQYLSAAAELASLQQKVALETNNARATIAREANIARQQTQNLQKALEEQRNRILKLKSTQDDYSVLQRDAENAKAAYDNALKRGSDTDLESRLDHSNVAILNHATVPSTAAAPRLFLNLVLAALLAPLLAAAACVALELRNRRIHSRDDLLGKDFGPLLVEIPAAGLVLRRRRTHKPLVPRLRSEPAV